MSYTPISSYNAQTASTAINVTSTTQYLYNALGASITPKVTGKIFAVFTGNIANLTTAKGGFIKGKYGTGTAPALGSSESATTATQFGTTASTTNVSGAQSRECFITQSVITGLTIGTKYWFDILTEANANTASTSNVSISLIELGNMRSNTIVNKMPTDPNGTKNTTGVMMGLGSGVTFTCIVTGNIFSLVSGSIGSTGNGQGGTAYLKYGTGVAPSNGGALTGTTFGPISGITVDSVKGAGSTLPMVTSGSITGLTIGTKYWFDIGLASTSAAQTATTQTLNISIIEF